MDDPIEIDYNSCNTRVWRNRVTNGRMGISLAPIYGGPVYVFRNVFLNLETSAYKMNRDPAGLVMVHNTSIKLGNGTSSDAGWQNTLLRNNIIMGTRYVFEAYDLVDGSNDDWDYDALYTSDRPFAKWDNVRYTDLEDLRRNSSIESHAVAVAPDDLAAASLPAAYGEGSLTSGADLRLVAGAEAIDAGQPLTNINDPYVNDGKPDCGAYEFGVPLPTYGPRSAEGNDADGDGYVAVDQGGDDCDDANPAVNPGSDEVCGDGIDQDCSGDDTLCENGEDSPSLPGGSSDSGGRGCFVKSVRIQDW